MAGYGDRVEQPPIRQFGGLNTYAGEMNLPGNDSPFMLNVDLHPHGSQKKRQGTADLDSPDGVTGAGALIRLNQPDDSRGWIYIVIDDAFMRVPEPGTWTWQTPTYTGGAYTLPTQKSWGHAQSRYNNGTEYPSVLYLPRSDGAPMIALGLDNDGTGDLIPHPVGSLGPGGTPARGYPASWGANHWPRFMRLVARGRGSRMFAWGFEDDKSIVYYSEMDVPWNYLPTDYSTPTLVPATDGGFFYARKGDGDEVISVVDMFSYYVVFKRHTTLIYTGDPGVDETGYYPWRLQAEFPVGCVSDRAWVKVGNDILFWSEDGPRALSAVQEYGDIQQSQLAFKISQDVTQIVPDTYERICCYHDIPNMRVVWFVPLAGSQNNDAAFVYYYGTQQWTKWSGRRCEMNDVLVIRSTSAEAEKVIGATADSGLVLHDSTYADAEVGDTEDITTGYYTQWINVGPVQDAARALWLDVFYGDGGSNVDVYYQVDLSDEWFPLERIIRSYGGAGTAWGRFTWGNAKWGQTARGHKAWELDHNFRLIRFKFESEHQRNYEVMAYNLEVRRRGPRL